MDYLDEKNLLRRSVKLRTLSSLDQHYENEFIRIEVIKTNEVFDDLEQEWNNLVKLSGAHIFQTFEWQRIWWKHFGRNNRLHIVVFRNEGELIGIAPFYLESTRLFYRINFRKLRFIGSSVPNGGTFDLFMNYSPTDYLDIIAAPEYEDQITELLLLYLEKDKNQFNQIEFDEVTEDSFVIRKVLPLMKKREWCLKKIRMEICLKINITGSLDDYMESLSSKSRYDLRKAGRTVTKKKLFMLESAENIEDLRHKFEEFVEIHQSRWNKRGYPGIFANEGFKMFLLEITETFYKKGWMRFKIAKAGEKCLAVDYSFMYNCYLYDYQKAIDDSSPMAKHSPGTAIFYDMLKESIEEGCKVIDLLRGYEHYKTRIANSFEYNWRVISPDLNKQRKFIYKWYGFYISISLTYARISKELLFMNITRKQWGFRKFLPVYYNFIRNRINNVK